VVAVVGDPLVQGVGRVLLRAIGNVVSLDGESLEQVADVIRGAVGLVGGKDVVRVEEPEPGRGVTVADADHLVFQEQFGRLERQPGVVGRQHPAEADDGGEDGVLVGGREGGHGGTRG
jgi:hypothetical protein